MRKPFLLSALLSLFLVPAAQAAMPQFQASCGGMIETHDEDGTVYINGKPAKPSNRAVPTRPPSAIRPSLSGSSRTARLT